MDTSQINTISGEYREGELATVRFYGRITEESAARFNEEFDCAESVRPSLIRVLINSEGGSVLHGMSCYATIQNSRVPTECINEGMAASMGSVLWAAGDRSLMRDYAILMIHNPFLPGCDDGSREVVDAFTRQISTIYHKRFGLSKEQVSEIMAGKSGADGTFFDCEGAVEAGIIPAQNVLATTPQVREKVRVELARLNDTAQIQSMMSRISAEWENKPSEAVNSTLSQTQQSSRMSDTIKPSAEYSAVAAALGMKDSFEVKDVMARISELQAVEAKLAAKAKELSDAQTVIAGKEASIQNLQKNVSELTASLKSYKDKEAAEKKAWIENMVSKALAEGKIEKADEAKWKEMAEANAELTRSILASIPAREQISKEIASDPQNVQAAVDNAKNIEDKLAEKIQTVVGDDFAFRKIE